MKKLKIELSPENSFGNDFNLDGVSDIHIHTAPDVKPRLLNDIEAAVSAKKENMSAIVLKSHLEPTTGRAKIASEVSDFPVFGGVVLNNSVGGLNPVAVKAAADLGGKFIWFPTISYPEITIDWQKIEDIIHIIAENNMVMATGHFRPEDIFSIIDMARSHGIWKIVVNHPLTKIVGASIDEQVEMARYAYLEHCFVACMKNHDNLDPALIRDSIKKIGSKNCVLATDFGQIHNLTPVIGMKMFIQTLTDYGAKTEDIHVMTVENPKKLLKD
jgi:hypothetical protein